MLTCAALMVGVSMIVPTQGITGSFKVDLDEWIHAYMGGDIYVGAQIPLSRDLEDKLATLSTIEMVAPVRNINATWLRKDEEELISLNYS